MCVFLLKGKDIDLILIVCIIIIIILYTQSDYDWQRFNYAFIVLIFCLYLEPVMGTREQYHLKDIKSFKTDYKRR